MKKTVFGLSIAAFSLETLMAIPVLGGTLVIGSAYLLLVLALTVHIALLVLRSVLNKQEDTKLALAAPIVGTVGSLLAWIPIIGWIMHLATAILYLVEIANKKNKYE